MVTDNSKPLFTFAAVDAAATGMIQQPPVKAQTPEPAANQPKIYAFPPAQSTEYGSILQEIAVHSARLQTAQARQQTILIQTAFRLGLKESEAVDCQALQNPNGAFVFSCPPKKTEEAPAKSGDAPVKDKAGQ